jgi:integrase
MTKQVRNAKFDTATARASLKVRPSPYWAKIGAKGCHLGYRRVAGGFGHWLARWGSGDRIQKALGTADDILDANGTAILSWPQAQEKARAFFDRCERGVSGKYDGPVTVRQTLVDYFKHRKLNTPKAVASDLRYANARIIPQLGEIEVRKLTRAQLQSWLDDLAVAPVRKRTAEGYEQQFFNAPVTNEEKRARKVSANRVWAILRAALNHAADQHDGLSTDAWSKIKPFRKVETARVRFLDDSLGEQVRLVNACEPDFRDLVRAGLLTGARYGELRQVRREDFNGKTLFISGLVSKTGKERYIHLTEEGIELFVQRCRGLEAGALIFTKVGGTPWQSDNQLIRFANACKAAGIVLRKGEGFHILRHSYASHLIKKGVPLKAIANQLGHTTTAMVERNYGHLADTFVSEAVQKAMGSLGIVEPSNVAGIYDKQPA